MADPGPVAVVAVGSVALDTIETPSERREDVLGGSASYACAASSFFCPVGMVGVVGDDFDEQRIDVYRHFNIDVEGLQKTVGKTFRWSGVYEEDMNDRRTISTDLNVFADFKPTLPASYLDSPFLFLANISPDLQLHVLSEVTGAKYVVADSMDLWINTAREDLVSMISRVDLLMLNDSEVRLLAGEGNTVTAARKVLELGPDTLIVKKGEHGAIMFSEAGMFIVPAYPLEDVVDPTGAGDSFAGGFIGSLAETNSTDEASVRKAMLYGSVVASFGVESFGLDRFRSLTRAEIDDRLAALTRMITV